MQSKVVKQSQDSESGCPTLAILIFGRHPFFPEVGQNIYIQITTIRMTILIEKSLISLYMQCQGNHIDMEIMVLAIIWKQGVQTEVS